MKLVDPYRMTFLEAFEASFDAADISVILYRRFNIRLKNITTEARWPNQSQDIYHHFEFRNELERLVAVCRDARPSVPEFAYVLDSLNFTNFVDAAGAAATAQEGHSKLEALLTRTASPYQDVVKFRGDLSRLEGQVCRIAAGSLSGTGVLVAPDLVITNSHVMAQVASEQGELIGKASCTFDDKKGGSSYRTPKKVVAVSVMLASSPYAQEDLVPGPAATSLNHLDYAVLKLAEAVGDQPVALGGEARGFVDLANLAQDVAPSSGLIILQHPQGLPMKVDIGAVLGIAGARLRHSVNTEPGSSGAPVFDGALRLAALHHAGHGSGPGGAAPGYNQAIPIALIISDARKKGVPV